MRSSALLVLLSAASPAFSSVLASLEAIRRGMAQLEHRQAPSSSFDLSFTGVQGNTATTSASSSSGSASGSATTTGSGSSSSGSSSSGSSSGSGSASSSGNNTASTQTFDDRLPAGGVQMVTPAPTAQASYYKIGNYATFAWNYTSLSVTPSAVDVLATCTLNQATYTIAQNLTVSNATQAVTWDTGAYQQTASVPLLTETYTLIIHDAAQDVSATAKAGYLATYNQFVFGMYVPQPYTPIAQWTCATCNSALSAMERQTIGFVFSMAFVTILSFGWFGNLFGLF